MSRVGIRVLRQKGVPGECCIPITLTVDYQHVAEESMSLPMFGECLPECMRHSRDQANMSLRLGKLCRYEGVDVPSTVPQVRYQ
jgi:hypothetical protein